VANLILRVAVVLVGRVAVDGDDDHDDENIGIQFMR